MIFSRSIKVCLRAQAAVRQRRSGRALRKLRRILDHPLPNPSLRPKSALMQAVKNARGQ
jgi:hypothetical protein